MVTGRSDQLLLLEDLLQSGVAFPGGPHEAGDSDDGGLAEVDGSVVVELHRGGGTSATDSCTDA